MALEQAKEFLAKLIADDSLKDTFSQIKPEDAPARAKEMGFEFTLEELETAEKEYREANGSNPEKLNPDHLDNLAGGELWDGEDAPDGHEMGCILTYHGRDWQFSNDIYCNTTYYCCHNFLGKDRLFEP